MKREAKKKQQQQQAESLNSKLAKTQDKAKTTQDSTEWSRMVKKKNIFLIWRCCIMIVPYWLHIHRILIAATPIKNLRTPSGAEMNKRGSYSRRAWNYLLNPLSVFSPFPSFLNPYHAGYWSILFAFICVKIYVSVATDFWRRCFANLRSWRFDLFLDLGGCCSGKPGISKLCCMNPSLF